MSHIAEIQASKREHTKQQNRQAILDAAREVFGELGYEAATVRDIIRRTGLASGTFYNYYRSKEEVHAALSDEGARQFTPVLRGLRASAPDPASFVASAIRAYFDYLADAHRNWAARRPPGEARPSGPGETPEMAAVFAEVRDAVVEALAAGGGVGAAGPAADPDYMAAASIAVARAVGAKMLERRPIDAARAAEFASGMILAGLRDIAP
jgi:AcrR family transcriptional regulator